MTVVKKLKWTKGVVDIAQPMPGMKYVACSTTPKGSWAFWLDHAPETHSVFTSEEAAKAAAQADYSARILSALEPSAARELALEEGYRRGVEAAAKLIECGCKSLLHGKGECQFPGNCSLEDAAAIRALSSPDHADAGKVEGDVEKWSIREIVAKAIAYHSVGDPHAKTIRGDQRWEWFVEEANKFISVFGYYLPAIPSAPASEGAK